LSRKAAKFWLNSLYYSAGIIEIPDTFAERSKYATD